MFYAVILIGSMYILAIVVQLMSCVAAAKQTGAGETKAADQSEGIPACLQVSREGAAR